MAQTIAIQRGTGSLASNSGVTLFTQSGGNATRVILSQLTWYVPAGGTIDSAKCTLTHVSTTGATSVIAYFSSITSGADTRQGQLVPNFATDPLQRGFTSSATMAINGAINGTALNYPGSTYGVNLAIGDTNYSSYMPTNYWIGPSDSIKLWWYEGNTKSITYGFSFTTVTES